jgi:hypothetical protein
MASFDPSALQDIQGPDIAGSITKGFQLKDLVDTTQLNTLKLNNEKQDLQRKEKMRSLLSTGDVSTDVGVAKKAEEMTKAGLGPEAMDFVQHAQKVRSGELDNELKRVDLHVASQDVIAGTVDKIWQQATAMKNEKTPDGRPKYTDASVNAWIQGQIPMAINSVQSDSGLPEDVKKTALQGIMQSTSKQQGPITYDALTEMERGSKRGQAQLASHRADLVAQTGQKREEEHERHDEKMESLAATNPNRTPMAPQSGDLLAALTEKGVTLPQGLRSRQVLQQTLQGLIARNPGKSVDEIADQVKSGALTMGTEKTEASVLGRREAAILPVEKSITKPGGFLEQAEKAVDSVDFSKLKAAGSFEKWTKDQESDPDLSRYKAAVAELRAEYSIVLSKGGQVTDAARHEAEKVIPDLITKDQFKSIKQVVLQGIEASKSGVEESIQGVTGGKPSAPAAPAQNDPLGIRGG